MKHSILALFTLLTLLGSVSCSDDPQVSGPTTFLIGQHVDVTLTKGTELAANDFEIIDAAGRSYTPANTYIEYNYIAKNHFEFRIPPGMADGEAQLIIGSKGDTYNLTMTVVRGLAYSDGAGTLYMTGLLNPDKEYKSATIGVGKQIIRVVDDYSSIVSLTPASGRIDWLSVDSKDRSTFSTVAPSVAIQTSTVGVNASPKDVSALPGRLVIATDIGLGTMKVTDYGAGQEVSFEKWIDDSLDYKALAGSTPHPDTGVVRFAGVGEDSMQQSVLTWFDSDVITTSSPAVNSAVLSTTSSMVSDVAISQDGGYAAAVIPDEGKLCLVDLNQANTPTCKDDLSECVSPSEVLFTNDSESVAVLCTGSGKVMLFSLNGTTANPSHTLEVGDSENNPLSMFLAADGTVYVSIHHGGIKYFDGNSSNPMVNHLEGSEAIDTASFIVQP